MPRFLIPLLMLLLVSFQTFAHPVAFRNSVGIMGSHSPTLTHNQVNYSFLHWVAVGVHHFKRPDSTDNRHASLASTNLLLKRWNGDALQANVYAVLGAGQSELSGHSKTSGLGVLQFDIEDRKYYFLSKHLQIVNDDQTDLEQSVVRAGIAPYVGSFDDFHSWIILEWTKSQFASELPSEDTTPMLRFFYRNLLFEIGQSFNGATKFNYISHF